jgi:hemolysin III
MSVTPSWQLQLHAGERFNTFTHLLGLALALVGGSLLLQRALAQGDLARTIGVGIFVLAAIALYAASCLFHSSRGSLRTFAERADHCAIYGLIAGSYTPFAQATADSGAGWAMLAGVWALAGWAICRAMRTRAGTAPPLVHYLVLGWLCVLGLLPVAARLNAVALGWLLAGAVAYSVGTVFYRNHGRWRHAHGTWHLFVVAGTGCHYAAVLRCLAGT